MIDVACSSALLGATLAAAVAYAARVSRLGAARHARIDRAGGSPLLGKRALQMGYWAMQPPARACVALGIGADAVTWASLALAAGAGAALAFGHFGVGAALAAASFACDALDGLVARETGVAGEAGEVLDAAVDRYGEMLVLGGIAVHERTDAPVLALVLAALAGAVMVSYSTAKAEAMQVQVPRGAMRRQERAVYVVLGTALAPLVGVGPLVAALALVAVVGNASAVRRLRAVARDPHAAAREALR